MELRHIAFETIRPFVRFAQEMYLTEPRRPAVAYDYRLFYVLNGGGSLKTEGEAVEIHAGTAVYLPSGTVYSISPGQGTTLHLIVLNFDCTQDGTRTVRYLPMVTEREYDPEKRMELLQFTDAPEMNKPVFLQSLPGVLPYLQTILAEVAAPDNFSAFQTSQLLALVLNQIQRQISQRQSVREQSGSFRKILEYIQDHYREELDNRTLGQIFNYHPNYVNQLFAEHTGVSVHQYLLKIRIRQALELLQTTELPINEIAAMVGFKNSSYFSQYFKKSTGYSPRDFRIS